MIWRDFAREALIALASLVSSTLNALLVALGAFVLVVVVTP